MAARVTGMREGSRRFKAFPAAVVTEIEAALDKGADEIRDRAKAIAPRDTGELRRAIEVRDTLDGFTAGGAVGNFGRMVRGAAGRLQRFIGVFPDVKGAPGWYAAFVEFGTAPRVEGQRYTQASGKRRKAAITHPGTQPRPFLKPAFFSLRRRVVGRINRAIGSAAKKVARRG